MSIPQHHFSTSFSSLSRLNSTRYSELAGKTQLCSSLPPSLHFPHPSFPSPLFLLPLPLPYLFPPTPLLPSPYHPPPPPPQHAPQHPQPFQPSFPFKMPAQKPLHQAAAAIISPSPRARSFQSLPPPLFCAATLCVWDEWFRFLFFFIGSFFFFTPAVFYAAHFLFVCAAVVLVGKKGGGRRKGKERKGMKRKGKKKLVSYSAPSW